MIYIKNFFKYNIDITISIPYYTQMTSPEAVCRRKTVENEICINPVDMGKDACYKQKDLDPKY